MKSQGWKRRFGKLGLGLAAAFALSGMVQAQVTQVEPVEVQVVEGLPPTITLVADHLEELRNLKPSSHWIGVVVRPCDEVIRTHLKLEGGLVVDDVTPESPAAKAGIEKNDILLTLNEASVADLKGLMDFLSENKEKIIVVKVLHAGEPKTVEVTPAERPQDQFKFFPAEGFNFALPEGKVPEEIQRWMKEYRPAPEGAAEFQFHAEPFRARFFRPGVLVEGKASAVAAAAEAGLPEGVQVIVVKEGDKPAKITVKRGEKTWELTEKQIEKLPEDLRPHIMKFVGPADHLVIRAEAPNWTGPAEGPRVKIFAAPTTRPLPQPVRVEAHAVRVAGPDVEKKLDEINGRLERIEKALEKLGEK